MESSDWPNSNYIFVSLSPCSCAGGRVSLADQSLRQETEAKELLYCGKGQRSWLFLRQADTVAVLKSTVKLDNKIVKQSRNRELHATVSPQPAYCGSKSQITASPNCSKFRTHVMHEQSSKLLNIMNATHPIYHSNIEVSASMSKKV